jgi:hypothetical protein
MRKKKIKQPTKRFKYLIDERKNILFNFRNNLTIKGSYRTLRWELSAPSIGPAKRHIECLAIPFRFKTKFSVGDVVSFKEKCRGRLHLLFKSNKRVGSEYFKITGISEEVFWDGGSGPYTCVLLDIKKLNNLEFLSAMNDMKNKQKKRGKK